MSRPAPWWSSASAPQSASLPTQVRPCHPNASSTAVASDVPVIPEVGGPGDGAVVLGDQAGYGDRGADRVRAVVAQQGGHVASEPGQGRLDFPDVGDGAGHPVPDRAGQVDDHCGDVLDVGLEADTHRPATGQGQSKPGPAAVATAHLLGLTDRAGLLEVTDDRAHRGLGQAGAAGELGAAGGPVVAQRPEHRRGIAAPDVRLVATDSIEVLERELVQPLEPRASGRDRLDVRERPLEQLLPALALAQRRLRQLRELRLVERLDHLGIRAERPHLLAQDQVVVDARLGGDPDSVVVLGAGGLEVEVDGAVVPTGEQGVDHPERAPGVAGAEPQVLVVLRAVLAVEVDVEELAVPQRLRVPGRGAEPGHLLVPDLGVDADQLGPVQGLDERERVADGGQQDVAARLVGLRLDREPQVVAAVDDVLAEQVERLLVAVQRGGDVLGRAVLRALAAAPGDVDLGAELGGQVDVAHHLADREPAYVAVVVGEAAVLEDRVREQVGRRGGDHQPGVGEALLEAVDDRRAGVVVAAERDQVVVVEVHAVRTDAGEPVEGVDRVHRRTGGLAERVARLPADGPEPERELVVGRGRRDVG